MKTCNMVVKMEFTFGTTRIDFFILENNECISEIHTSKASENVVRISQAETYPPHKNKGLFKELLKIVIDYYRKKYIAFSRLELTASPLNGDISTKELVALYKHCGFELDEGSDNHMHMDIN